MRCLGVVQHTPLLECLYNYNILCLPEVQQQQLACLYYISITIVQSYTGKYREFVAVCTVTSAQHE